MVSQFVLGLVSFAPTLGILYFVLGAQEEFFEHQSMFVALIGGLVLGVLAAIPEAFIRADAGALVAVAMFASIETMAKTMLVGLPRFQDQDETVMLGGATGVTMAAILLVFHNQAIVGRPLDVPTVVQLVGAAIGFTGASFVSGLRVGIGPARGSVLGGFLPGLLWLFPAHVFLYLAVLVPAEGSPAIPWVWAIPLAVYGLGIFVWKTPVYLEKALPREQRRKFREEGLF